jgi:hypothetical protein
MPRMQHAESFYQNFFEKPVFTIAIFAGQVPYSPYTVLPTVFTIAIFAGQVPYSQDGQILKTLFIQDL